MENEKSHYRQLHDESCAEVSKKMSSMGYRSIFEHITPGMLDQRTVYILWIKWHRVDEKESDSKFGSLMLTMIDQHGGVGYYDLHENIALIAGWNPIASLRGKQAAR